MEPKPVSLWKSSLTSGLYLGIFLILFSVIMYVAGLTFETWVSYLSYPILIAGAVYAQLNYKKSLGGEMTYGQALGVGTMAIIFASVLSAVYSYVLYTVIDPGLLDQVRIMTEQTLLDRGVPEEQLDATLKIAMKFQTPAALAIMGVLGGALIGLIISLITAIFTKKEPSDEVPE